MADVQGAGGADRRLLGPVRGWDAIARDFRWRIPSHYNIAERCCDSWAQHAPDKLAVIELAEDGSRREWTYGQLKAASDRLANALRGRGLRRGDRLAILLPQGPAVLIAHFAAMKLGAIALPLFTLFGPEALAYRLGDSGARMLVTDGENLPKIMELWPDLPALKEVLSLSGARAPARDFWAEIAAASETLARVETAAEDPAMMIYTSGTTGAAKGCLHAHRFLLGHLPSMELHQEGFPQPGDCGWTPADWAWIGGLMDMAIPCLYYGVPLVSRRMRKFDPDEAYALVAAERVRNLFLPPTALKLMRAAKMPARVDIRAVSSGGESLGAEMLAWGQEVLRAPINEIYGQTECNLLVATVTGLIGTRPGAMGKAVPGHDMAVIDAAGQPLPPGELGEIAVRRGTPVMFLEYWNKPEKTAEKFRGDWMLTGDLGTCDAEGWFTYVARADDVITSAGYRIGPSEIEDCLMGHPDVAMAAAVGAPDALRGEVVKAFVVLRPGTAWGADLEAALIARVRERVSPHVVPRQVVAMESLPMTATGKILRRELRDA